MYKDYIKPATQKMRPYVEGEDMSMVSVSATDTPEIGGMIAVNKNCPADMWYVSKEFFGNNYEPVEVSGLTFGVAVENMKKGNHVARKGWNGKGMWLCLIHPGNASHKGFDMQDCIGMKTAGDVMQPGWLASQNDILAEDWCIVNAKP